MKISRLEFVTLLLTAAFLSFSAGWFLRGNAQARPIAVETERVLAPAERTPAVLPAPSPAAAAKVNINSAPAEELQTLPGIGEKRAADIVAYREEHGPFRIPEDLTRVPGIGESILEGLLDFITTGE